ncbi:MAG: hypothetical protein KJO38_04085, partial [Gammaproteobacteria bacterium]|nr:hypothetical protein [Gammaproteobacteria bacterium]
MIRVKQFLRAAPAAGALLVAAAAPAETEIRAEAEIFASPLAQAAVPDVQSAASGPLPETDVAIMLDAAAAGYAVNATASVDLLAAELRVYLGASSDAPNPEWTGPPGTFGPDPVAQASAAIDEYLT